MNINPKSLYIAIFYLIHSINSFWVKTIIQNYIIPKFTPHKIISNSRSQHREYIQQNNIQQKKIISISPGGLLGFYMFGTCAYIKEHYDLSNYIFSGASAGAWNSLFMIFRGEPIEFITDIIGETQKIKKIIDIEKNIKSNILTKYNESHFDLDRLFIGVTAVNHFQIYTNIYSGFDGLDDAIECCIASSHIPFINGPIINKYKNIYTFDGGFSKNPYLISKSVLHITPSIWQDPTNKKDGCNDMMNIFYREKYDFWNLFQNGYDDAKKNKGFLDTVFL